MSEGPVKQSRQEPTHFPRVGFLTRPSAASLSVPHANDAKHLLSNRGR